MTTQILLLALGFGVLIKGADWLVDGAAALARNIKGFYDRVVLWLKPASIHFFHLYLVKKCEISRGSEMLALVYINYQAQ